MGGDKFALASGALLVSPGSIRRDGSSRSWLGTLEALAQCDSSLASLGGELLMLWPAKTAAMVTPGTDAYSLL